MAIPAFLNWDCAALARIICTAPVRVDTAVQRDIMADFETIRGLSFEKVVVSRANKDSEHSRKIVIDRGSLAVQRKMSEAGHEEFLIVLQDAPERAASGVVTSIRIPVQKIHDIEKSLVASKDRRVQKGKTTIRMNEPIEIERGVEVFTIKMSVEDHDLFHQRLSRVDMTP